MVFAVPLRLRYAASFAALVTIALLGSGLLQLSLAYQQNQAALALIQKEQAAAAADRIQRFAVDVGRDLTRANAPVRSSGQEGIEERRIGYLRLLREAPPIAAVSYLDGSGRELIRVSQLALTTTGSGPDRSHDPVFAQARRGRPYFGPLYFHGGAEPYASVSIAEPGPDSGVAVAEVKLNSVWDEISRIRVGQAGLAYVVDSAGVLVAHPTVGLVLNGTDVSSLTHIQQALVQVRGEGGAAHGIVGRDLHGRQVLATYAFIDPPGWFVVMEQPLEEALAPLNSLILGTAGFLVLGLLLSLAASWALARSMAAPIRQLQMGAARIGAGALAERIHVRTGDELQELAGSFNAMADQLEKQIEALRESRARVVAVQEGVRRDIASHLHGRVQGQLLALRGRLQEALEGGASQPEHTQAVSEVAEGIGRVAQEEISVLSRRLYPAMLRRGLTPALHSLVDQFELVLPVKADVHEGVGSLERADPGSIPEGVRLAAYRIVEEALGNALKHAHASAVIVEAEIHSGEKLRIAVRDNGRGFNPGEPRDGLGLMAMQDYAAAVGGVCEFRSSAGQTEIVAVFPVGDDQRGPADMPDERWR